MQFICIFYEIWKRQIDKHVMSFFDIISPLSKHCYVGPLTSWCHLRRFFLVEAKYAPLLVYLENQCPQTLLLVTEKGDCHMGKGLECITYEGEAQVLILCTILGKIEAHHIHHHWWNMKMDLTTLHWGSVISIKCTSNHSLV